ncbi:MAG TPA: tetratricopeptide repeat protein, partial [Gemmataceae bacterium]|nr:tetratricopeptide repeat protein [Gemmataceae bacterium]
GDKDEAEKNLRLAVKLGAKEPEAWVALCQFLATNGRKPEGEKLIPQAESALPNDVKAMALARCFEVLGQAEQARQLYQEALQARPDDMPTIQAVVNFHIRGGRLSDAEPLLNKVFQGKYKEGKTWARRGLALVQAARGDLQHFGEALAFVGLRYDAREGQVVEVEAPADGVSVDDRRVQAQVLATQPVRAFRSKAIACLLEVEKRGALTVDDRALLVRLYESDGNVARAREQWQALVNAQAANPAYLAGYADHLLRTRQLNEAGLILKRLDEVEKAKKVEAGTFGSVELTARWLEARGEGAKALELLRGYVARKGSRPTDVFLLVSSLARQKQLEEALALCDKAWEDCPSEVVSRAVIGLLRAGPVTPDQVARAQQRIEEASRKHPDDALYLLHLADIHDLRGDYLQAQAIYRRVLDKDGKNFVALNNLAWLLAQTSGDKKEALQLVGRAIEALGERPELLDTRASVFLAQKQADRAIADLEKANADARTDARSFRLAQAYLLANDRANAARAFHEAQQAGLKAEQLHPTEQKAFRQLVNELTPQ